MKSNPPNKRVPLSGYIPTDEAIAETATTNKEIPMRRIHQPLWFVSLQKVQKVVTRRPGLVLAIAFGLAAVGLGMALASRPTIKPGPRIPSKFDLILPEGDLESKEAAKSTRDKLFRFFN